MRILLIEDDLKTARSVEAMLNAGQFNVYTTDLGGQGIDLAKVYDYDIILLDLELPDISGYEVLGSLRAAKVKTPILIVSGNPEIESKVRGLALGADDYMTKPFHRDELIARIEAIVRRSKASDTEQPTISATNFIVAYLDELARPASTAEIRNALRKNNIPI